MKFCAVCEWEKSGKRPLCGMLSPTLCFCHKVKAQEKHIKDQSFLTATHKQEELAKVSEAFIVAEVRDEIMNPIRKRGRPRKDQSTDASNHGH